MSQPDERSVASLLVVDDEPLFCLSAQEILSAEGYRVDTALGGTEALARLRVRAYDLVLLDLLMPEVSGEEVLTFIQSQGLDTAVLIVSGTDSVDQAVAAMQAGAGDLLRKPYRIGDLLSRVECALQDLNQQRQHRRLADRLRESERRFRLLAEHSPDIVFTLDEQGRLQFVNQRLSKLLGTPADELLGRPFGDSVGAGDQAKWSLFFARVLEARPDDHTIELQLRGRQGPPPGEPQWMPFEIKVTHCDQAQDGVGTNICGSGRDLSARRAAENHIRQLAYFDALTGLPNRQLFSDRLQHALLRAQRTQDALALLFLDLDQFKYVNDTLGHPAGDQLLRQVAERLRPLFRKDDSFARMGGDEFTVLLEKINGPRDASVIARKILQTLAEPFQIEGRLLRIGASIGISLYPQDGQDHESLLESADVAMYQAKRRGRNNFQFYATEMSRPMLRRLDLEQRLCRALPSGQLVVHYQPRFDLQHLGVTGIESLVRWQDPADGLIGPQVFLPMAEHNGLILELGDWILRSACAQAQAWTEQGVAFGRLVVNLSANQLLSPDIETRVGEALGASGLSPTLLELDISEHVQLDSKPAVAALHQLRNLGVTIALDDFGTGRSSISLLKHLRVDLLKIDRALVRDLTTEAQGEAVVRAILALGHNLSIAVTAKGVETEEQWQRLTTLGCREAQGFLFARPLPDPDIRPFLLRAPGEPGP